ncbi:hypothetical protein ACKWTF_015810 [Chironomus riparius]
MSIIEKMECESWNKFAMAEGVGFGDLNNFNAINNFDDDFSDDSAASSPANSSMSWDEPQLKKIRLNRDDCKIYGNNPSEESFTLVTCNKCGLVLKQQALFEHFEKRHATFVEDIDSKLYQIDEVHVAKRRRFDIGTEISAKIVMNIVQDAMDVEELPNEFRKITLKLRRNSGQWSVVGC